MRRRGLEKPVGGGGKRGNLCFRSYSCPCLRTWSCFFEKSGSLRAGTFPAGKSPPVCHSSASSVPRPAFRVQRSRQGPGELGCRAAHALYTPFLGTDLTFETSAWWGSCPLHRRWARSVSLPQILSFSVHVHSCRGTYRLGKGTLGPLRSAIYPRFTPLSFLPAICAPERLGSMPSLAHPRTRFLCHVLFIFNTGEWGQSFSSWHPPVFASSIACLGKALRRMPR